jgi:hypothetical protein
VRWGGVVAALQESLRHIELKKLQGERLRQQAERGDTRPTALG